MAKCLVHGIEKSGRGIFKKCGLCEQADTIALGLKSKIPMRPIEVPEDSDKIIK